MTGEENWATRHQAEVDGIPSSRFDMFNGISVVARELISLIDGHSPKCIVCRGVGDPYDGMRVKQMSDVRVALKPYPWLA